MGHLKFLLLVLGVMLAVTLSACAAKRGGFQGPPPERLADMREEAQKRIVAKDLDGDGLLTCADTDLRRAELFWLVDEDESKSLDAKEYIELRWHEKIYVLLVLSNDDKDGDGVVSLAELQARADPFFSRVDINRDCEITPEELGQEFRLQRAGDNGRDGRPRGKRRRVEP